MLCCHGEMVLGLWKQFHFLPLTPDQKWKYESMSNNVLSPSRQTPHLQPVTCEKAQAPVQGWVTQAPCLSFQSHRACDGSWERGASHTGRSLIRGTALSTVTTSTHSKRKLWTQQLCTCNYGRIGSSNPHVDFWSPYLPGWSKKKVSSVQYSMLQPFSSLTLLGSQTFQSYWWAMHLVSTLETEEAISCELLFSSLRKIPGGMFCWPLWCYSEAFALTLCVESTYDLCAVGILVCPFVLPLLQVKTVLTGQTDHHLMHI